MLDYIQLLNNIYEYEKFNVCKQGHDLHTFLKCFLLHIYVYIAKDLTFQRISLRVMTNAMLRGIIFKKRFVKASDTSISLPSHFNALKKTHF